MYKTSDVIGLPVISLKNGEKISVIKDIIFCPSEKKITAFIIERKNKDIYKKILMLNEIVSLGKDAVVVKDRASLIHFKDVKKNTEFKENIPLQGVRVFSRNGNDIGVVADIFFDDKSGRVEGVEISDGIIQDIYKGRNIIPLFGKVEFGKDNILIDNEVVEEMINTGGGLKNKIFF